MEPGKIKNEPNTNLLVETEEALKRYGYKWSNVKYILNKEGYITVADFVHKARDTYYYNGYGTVEIDQTLRIVGVTWWLERVEYDGKEWWELRKKPLKPELPAVDFVLNNGRYRQ